MKAECNRTPRQDGWLSPFNLTPRDAKVARNRPKDTNGASCLNVIYAMVNSITPLDDRRPFLGVEPCHVPNRFCRHRGKFRDKLRCIFLDSRAKKIKPYRISVNKGLVIERFFDNDMDHSKGKGEISSRFYAKPKICHASVFSSKRVNHNKPGTHFQGFQDPRVDMEKRFRRVLSPHDDGFGGMVYIRYGEMAVC